VAASKWSIKDILGPIITRIIAYGINPIDIERVIKKLESIILTHARILEECWWEEWDTTAKLYKNLAKKAEEKNNKITAREMYYFASACYYAASLINYITIEQKKQAYLEYMEMYRKCTQNYNRPIIPVEITYRKENTIPGYLHLPEGDGPFPCVIILTGVGTSKEETHFSAQPLVDRKIAALTLDLPGTGESLFCRDLKFRLADIEMAVAGAIQYLENSEVIIHEKIGVYGICMGGTLAYKIASVEKRFAFCATAFPLRIEKTIGAQAPLWMKTGQWYQYFSGGIEEKIFLQELTIQDNEAVECAYVLIHGSHDNWTLLQDAMSLYHRARGKKDKIILEDEAAITGESSIIHTMPVGEQYHWVKHVVADWIKMQL
jgi:dienelactone hydrolase